MSSEQATYLNELAQIFYLDRRANACTASTLCWYRRYVGALLTWMEQQSVTTVDQVTGTHMRAYLVDLQGRKLAPRTIHHHASAARALFNFAVNEQIIRVSPMARVKMPRLPKEQLKPFEADEARAILKVCDNERDRAIVLTLLDTGLRASEFASLNVGDLDGETGAVVVHRGKGNKARTVYVGPRAHRQILRYLKGRDDVRNVDPLWTSLKTGGRLTSWGLRLMLRRLGVAAGVEPCTPHMFRRTFAIASLRAGMNIYALARLMGHADVQVMLRYLRLVEHDLQDAHREHGAVDSLFKGR